MIQKFEIINLTPHDAVLMNEKEDVITTIPASGKVARCTESFRNERQIEVNGVVTTFSQKIVGATENLPPARDGILYYVSSFVANDNPNRGDLITPAAYVRNDKGHVIGVIGVASLL